VTAVIAASALLIAACGDDDESADSTAAPAGSAEPAETSAPPTDSEAPTTESEAPTTDTPTTDTEAPAAEGWTVDLEDCVDPDAATAPIEGTVKIGSAMPLSGGVAAAAFAPVKDGFEAYIAFANENNLLDGYTIELGIEDDQYNAELTPGAVATQIDAGANLFAGIIGTPNNAAVKQQLNDECIPQLNALTGSPSWGDVENFPWTTGLLVPYTVESKVYAAQIAADFPDGSTAALFHVSNEFGEIYADAFKEEAEGAGIEIVGEETIEATDQAPPVSQITNIAALAPDVIMAVPLGAQCITFLTEVANAKAANPAWTPVIYITNTCASSLILGAAGPAADGLVTSSNGIDVTDPANASVPAVAEYLAFMDAQGKADIAATAVAGWTTGEITVAILAQAAASDGGLTRVSIIEAARNFTYEPSLAVDGVTYTSQGVEDPFLAESLVVRTYDATSGTFTDVGELITDFES
jgi:ABC-type branched-subunit amino acid transport system substrate-binding protein